MTFSGRPVPPHFFVYFPLFFAALWCAVTTLLGVLSGWFTLMQAFPDQPEPALLRLRGRSGTMGSGVRMNSVLRLSVCPSGLRVGMMRLFGPFNRSFFVRWNDLTVEESATLLWPSVLLRFGDPAIGKLAISAFTARKLAAAARGRWPDTVPAIPYERSASSRRLVAGVLFAFGLGMFVFVIQPKLTGNQAPHLAVAFAVLAFVFAATSAVNYFNRRP